METNVFLSVFNGENSAFLDGCMGVYAIPYVWIPFALVSIYVVLKNNNFRDFLVISFIIAAMSAILSAYLFFARQPLFALLHSLTNMSCPSDTCMFDGGSFLGMVSVFAAVSYLLLLIRHGALSFSLLLWAVGCVCAESYRAGWCFCDSVADVVVGILFGMVFYVIYMRLSVKRRLGRSNPVSNRFTKSGYDVADIYLMLIILYATFALIPVISFFAVV